MSEKTFEQAMARLDEIVSALDGGTLSLDASLVLFSEGAQLIAFCNSTLEDAKLTLEQLFPADSAPFNHTEQKGDK